MNVIRAETRRLVASRYVSDAWLKADFVSTEDPIIIGGCSRSGTTLMSVIVNSHSTVRGVPEDALLANDFSLKGVKDSFEYDFSWLLSRARASASRGEFTDFIIRDQKQRHGATRFASKCPRYTLSLGYLFQRFPSARFLYLCRDGRDVTVSLRRNAPNLGSRYDIDYDEAGMPSIKYCANAWRLHVNAFSPFEADRRCKWVRYEDLCRDPQAVVEDVCAFLGLDFEEQMLSYYDGKGTAGHKMLDAEHMIRVKAPVDSKQAGRWQDELTLEQVREFERYAFQELLHAGYELAAVGDARIDKRRFSGAAASIH